MIAKEILQIAMEQSAEDMGCSPGQLQDMGMRMNF